MAKNTQDHNHEDYFKKALLVIFLSISIVVLAFMSEKSKITGLATNALSAPDKPILREFDTVGSLRTLAPGTYYIDSVGIVYWVDDGSQLPIAHVNSINDGEKYRKIYIDYNGNIGYLIG